MIRIRARKPWGVGRHTVAEFWETVALPALDAACIPAWCCDVLPERPCEPFDTAQLAAFDAIRARMRHRVPRGRTLLDDATADRLALLLMFAPDVCDDEGVWS